MGSRKEKREISEMNETISEMPSKILLAVDAVNKGNEEVKDLLRILIEEIRKSREERKSVTDVLLETVTKKLDSNASAITQSIKIAAKDSSRKRISSSEVQGAKRSIMVLWRNTINTRKQAYWNYYRAQQISETFEDLLSQDPPKMPRKFLPKMIVNEPEEELEIRKHLSIEKFKAEINLQRIRAEKYKERYLKIDEDMIGKINAIFKEGISEVLKDQWMEECAAQKDISAKIFSDKREWFLENASSEFRQEQDDNNYEEKNRHPAIGPKGKVSQRKEDPTNGGHRSADETNTRQDFWHNQQTEKEAQLACTKKLEQIWEQPRERTTKLPPECPPPPIRNRSHSRNQNRKDVKFEAGAITAERNLANLNAQEEDNGITRDQENGAEGRRNDGNNNFLCGPQGAMNNHNQ